MFAPQRMLRLIRPSRLVLRTRSAWLHRRILRRREREARKLQRAMMLPA